MRRGRETDGLDDSLHGPVPHAGAQGNGPPTFPVRELHLHDNRGFRDDHLPVGEGSINFRGVLIAAGDAGAKPILTVEPHREDHFPRSIVSLRTLLADIA